MHSYGRKMWPFIFSLSKVTLLNQVCNINIWKKYGQSPILLMCCQCTSWVIKEHSHFFQRPPFFVVFNLCARNALKKLNIAPSIPRQETAESASFPKPAPNRLSWHQRMPRQFLCLECSLWRWGTARGQQYYWVREFLLMSGNNILLWYS